MLVDNSSYNYICLLIHLFQPVWETYSNAPRNLYTEFKGMDSQQPNVVNASLSVPDMTHLDDIYNQLTSTQLSGSGNDRSISNSFAPSSPSTVSAIGQYDTLSFYNEPYLGSGVSAHMNTLAPSPQIRKTLSPFGIFDQQSGELLSAPRSTTATVSPTMEGSRISINDFHQLIAGLHQPGSLTRENPTSFPKL